MGGKTRRSPGERARSRGGTGYADREGPEGFFIHPVFNALRVQHGKLEPF